VFIQWLLSKEGQTAWSSSLRINGARTDIPVVDPDAAQGKVVYETPTREDWLPNTDATQSFLKKMMA